MECACGTVKYLLTPRESASMTELQAAPRPGAINPQSDWQAQVEQALSAYFGALACNPVLLRTLFIEILGLGMPGLAARQRVNQQVVDLMLEVVNNRPGAPLRKAPLQPMMAMAVVGSINEMVLQSIEQGRAGQLQ